jgi:hypothetical protein
MIDLPAIAGGVAIRPDDRSGPDRCRISLVTGRRQLSRGISGSRFGPDLTELPC